MSQIQLSRQIYLKQRLGLSAAAQFLGEFVYSKMNHAESSIIKKGAVSL